MASPSAQPMILVAGDELPDAVFQHLLEASRMVGVDVLRWKQASRGALPKKPQLMVAWLSAGARQVPDDVALLLSEAFAEVPLLLLCSEPLVRPNVTTHEGRVTLVGPPLSSARIQARLRTLLSGASDAVVAPQEWASGTRAPLATSEYRAHEYWVGTLGGNGQAAWPMPSIQRRRGLTLLLGETAPAQGTAERVIDVLADAASDDEREVSLCDLVGGDASVLHLSPGAKEWQVYFPRGDWSLFLSSAQRLPHVTDLSRTLELSRRCWLRLRAAPGDLMFALTREAAFVQGAEGQTALSDGGPALLDLVRSQTYGEAPCAGAVVEVI
ncbi:MAG: hypothetical protein QM756_08905 [Polyangiaceae bacterium]